MGNTSSKLLFEVGFKGYDAEKFVKDCISMWLSLLDNRENYYRGFENGSTLKDHVQSLKNGIEFLGKLYLLSTSTNLAKSMRQLDVDVKRYSLTIYEEHNEDLRRIMTKLVNVIKNDTYSRIFKSVDLRYNYRRIIDLLLENISVVQSTWYSNNSATGDGETVALEKKIGELRMALTYYKPLCICLAHSSRLVQMDTSLDSVINDAAVVIYLLFVDKMDKKTVVHRLNMVMRNVDEIRLNIYGRFLKFRSLELTSDVQGWFYILENLMHILATNSTSLNELNKHLYKELKELRTFVTNRGSEMPNCFLRSTESTESIFYKPLPIVCSIYVEEDMHMKLDHILVSVVAQIRLLKLRYAKEIKLYDYPRVDGLGFLEFFLGYLKELQEHKKMSVIRSEIEALHMDIHCLVSSLKTSEEKLPRGELWTHIVQLAYQAEYVVDLYLVIPDSHCISTLSNIVKEVKEIKEKVLALPDKSLHAEDVALTTSRHVHITPLHVNHVLVGFQEEIVDITEYLLTGESDLQVLSVVGMGGAGKTSLANHLFKESSVVKNFDTKAWCTVSQTYQIKNLLLNILNQINPVECDDSKMDDQELADKLCRSLKRRRYLVIIDDVWDVSIWNYLRRYFPVEKTRSRILITTREYNVASETKSKIHQLRALTEAESWELLQKKFLQQESLPTDMESIAKEVAKSCKGLPLSIVMISNLLQHAPRSKEMWNRIAKDVTSTILSDPKGKCKAIVELSYNHLPDNLKSCFLYLGVFPEDHKISVTRLVWLWVAEGLVRGRMLSGVCLEDVGKIYVDDLIKRSLLIPIEEKIEGGVKTVQLHDLLRDFCLEKTKEEQFLTLLDGRGIFDLSLCPRRISDNRGMDKHLPSFSWNNVRTIISFDNASDIERIMMSERMLVIYVLDMHELDESPSYLNHYVHLRYLALWNLEYDYRFFEKSSFSKLVNLQVLILCFDDCEVIEVPDFIWDLVKLRHIDISENASFPNHVSKKIKESTVLLEDLESLSKVELVYEDENWLRKLPKLQKLSCKFYHFFDDSLQEYRFPELDFCSRLTSLKVEYGRHWGEPEWCKVQLPATLRKLSLVGFNYFDSDELSGIGKSLPNLEVLKLRDSLRKWSVNDEFPNLKVLKIVGLSFKEWDASEDSFPKLEQLWLDGCTSLKEIPLTIAYVLNLRLLSIKYCNPSVDDSAREIEKIQADDQNLELKVHIISWNR